jgi:metal-dependent amidase/aminoacylase/carboxypeptidase family protein
MTLFSAFSCILICTLYIGNIQARRDFLAEGSSSLDILIQSILPNITNYRRDFHKYPEVGMDLTQTHDKLVRYLSGIGTIRTMYRVGIVVDIVGQGPPRGNPLVIALRFNII